MPGWKEQIDAIQKLRAERNQQDADLYATRIRLQKIIAALKEPGGQGEGQKKELEAKAARLNEQLGRTNSSLLELTTGIFADPHPRGAVANLDDSIPFLLLPVRVETRFMNTDQQNELWVRIYPDEIAIHTHEKILTDKEAEAGKTYWLTVFAAQKANGPDKEDRKKSAWSALVKYFLPQRSAWIALQTKPLNWSTDLSGINTANDLQFPPQDLTKTDSWSRAPRCNILPDKFVVQLYMGDSIVIERTGSLVPDELFVGPDPMDSKKAFQTTGNKLVFGDDYNWTSDFNKAVEKGMGLRIPINADQATRGFDKLIVLGVYVSADEKNSAEILEELLDNHHYSPDGLSLVKQGTPTNNTDTNGSGYTKNDPFSNSSYVTETGKALFDENSDCDGRALADALGISYKPLQYVSNADGHDYREAVAMNKALYPATLGYYFGTMLHPAIGELTQDRIRDFFVENVTGRGPLPAIRVGDQPYGVLLTSDFSKWPLVPGGVNERVPFINTVLNTLRYYEGVYTSLISSMNYAGKPGTDPSEVLMDILGKQAGSVAFYHRNAYSSDDLRNKAGFLNGQRYFDELSKSFDSKNTLLSFFISLGLRPADIPNFTIPQLFRLIFQHFTSTLDANNLIDNVPLSEDKIIREYAKGVGKNYINWLAEATTPDELERQVFGVAVEAPNQLLYLLLRKALLEQLHKASAGWFIKRDLPVEASLLTRNFHNIRPDADLTKWEVMKAPVKAAVPEHPQRNLSIANYLLTSGIDEEEAAFLKELKTALTDLAGLPTARLERCFTEHIDTCTYRLDAWQTALFKLRLEQLRNSRQTENHDESRKKGIYIGAYGWLENLKPEPKQQIAADTVPESLRPSNGEPLFTEQDNGGFVHAASLNHASAAAVLRSGYLAHASGSNPDVLSVNLSSERVRRALFILEGMQNGQQLEALLGYQFERGLHDRASADNDLLRLNSYIYDFRAAFPINNNTIKQQGDNTAAISIPANNVVNGVALAEKGGGFPYGATGGVTGASPIERDAIAAEKDKLSDSLDAVKDLLQSESVYQLVLGNFDRAGAVLNSLQEAKVPPSIDVINTPRSSNFTYTNRVTIQFEKTDPSNPASNPWLPVAMTDRAKMEPALNKWLKNFTGDADKLLCRVSHNDSDGNELGNLIVSAANLELQPIDLIYVLGDELNTGEKNPGEENKTAASELEQRIAAYYREQKLLANEQAVTIQFLLAGQRCFGELLPLLRMIKSLIIDSRPLHAEDFNPPAKKSPADPANPRGYDNIDLKTRVETLRTRSGNLLVTIRGISVDTQVTDKDGNTILLSNLGDATDELDKDDLDFTDAIVTFNDPAATSLQTVLKEISKLGIPDSFPLASRTLTGPTKLILLAQGRAIIHKLAKANADAKTLFDKAVAEADNTKKATLFIESAQSILSGAFMILPLFSYNNEPEIIQSHSQETELLQHAVSEGMLFPAEEWLHSVAHTRPKLGRWESIRTLDEIINGNPSLLNPVQIPFRDKDSWVAVAFPATYPGLDEDGNLTDLPFTISKDTLSVLVSGGGGFTAGAMQSGLLLDDWTEQIPVKEEITGVAFNYNRPDAMPPQALLLAVAPEVKGHWSWDELAGIVNDTFKRAKQRAIDTTDLDKLNSPQTSILLPALLANFTEYDLDISLDLRLNLRDFVREAPILTADQYKGLVN